MKKQVSIVLGVLLAFVFVSVSHAADTKIGYIDMQKAIQQSSAGKKAKKSLEKEFKKKKKELEKKEADLKKMGEDLEKKAMVLSDEVRAKKQQQFQQEMLKYREIAGKSQVELQKRERDLTKPIVDKLKGIVEKIAKKDGYAFVLERSEQSVVYAKKDFDITDKVLKEFEKKK